VLEDKTFQQALEDAEPHITEMVQEVETFGQAMELLIRRWIAEADTLTGQEWLDLPETTRALLDDLRAIMASWEDRNGNSE
jgi:hypothetical protein